MNILIFTDNHTLNKDIIAKKAKTADLIISLGDMSLMGHYLEEELKWMNSLGKQVLVIPGNHEEFTSFSGLCKRFQNILNVDRKIYVVEDIVFLGYGGGGFDDREKDFEALSANFATAMEGKKVSFLLTHGPPFNTALDYLARFEPNGHRGCKSYREFIDKYQPTYALSGHLHETFGVKQKVGKTTCWNVGDEGEIIHV